MSKLFSNMSRREQVLLAIVCIVLFIVLNAVLFSFFVKRQVVLRTALSSAQERLEGMKSLLAERELWVKRDAWLTENHPKLTNEATAAVQLLDQVKALAKEKDLTVENPRIEALNTTDFYRSVPVSVELVGSWPSTVAFLHAIQQPNGFIVFERASIKIDEADKTKMRASLRIAKWFAPNKS